MRRQANEADATALPLMHLPSPLRRDTPPECQASAPPDIPAGYVVGQLTRACRPADRVHAAVTCPSDKEETERVYEVRYYDTTPLAGSAPNAAGSAR